MMVIGYARAGHEVDVQRELAELGISSRVPIELVPVRRGKRRYADPEERPVWPNYIFIDCDAEQWHQLRQVKDLSPTTLFVGLSEARKVDEDLEAIEREYEGRNSVIRGGARLSEFEPGDMMEIKAGPLAGLLAKFGEIVEAAQDPFPRLRGEAFVMGQAVHVDLDPIDVKRVDAS